MVLPNKEDVIEALNYCVNKEICSDTCPYRSYDNDNDDCYTTLLKDAATLLKADKVFCAINEKDYKQTMADLSQLEGYLRSKMFNADSTFMAQYYERWYLAVDKILSTCITIKKDDAT